MRLRTAVTAYLLSMIAVVHADAPAISLDVTPRYGFEPATVEATLTLPPNYLNSAECLYYDNGDVSRSSCWPVNGQYAPIHRTIRVEHLGAGSYRFVACAQQASREICSAVVEVEIQ